MTKKKQVSWTTIGLGAITAILLFVATIAGSQTNFGTMSIQQIGIWLTGIFATIAAIIWLWSMKKGKEILHESEREFLGSLTAFSTLNTFVGVPVLKAFGILS